MEEEKARVQQLLDNLRIEAILIVLCLSSSAIYRCIINNEDDFDGKVNAVLGEDQWWIDLKRLRYVSSSTMPVAASALRKASRAFVDSLTPSHRPDLLHVPLARHGSTSNTGPFLSIAPPKRRQSMAVLPPSITMRMGVGKPGFFNHSSSESSSESSAEQSDVESDSESDTNQVIASDEFDEEVDAEPDYFSSSVGTTDPLHTPKSPLDNIEAAKRGTFSASAHASLEVDDDDRPHVSFKSTPHPPHRNRDSDIHLNFNILPAKAQYLILNDLIRSQSADTAVVFTTLPAPGPGTHQDEEKSVEYVSGLELLCEDIPPVLLIHSNSLVVTSAL